VADDRKIDWLATQVYDLKVSHDKLVKDVVKLKHGLEVGDAVFAWDKEEQTGDAGTIIEIRQEGCFVRFAGKQNSCYFEYEHVSKLTGGDPDDE
jgi:hypothetical protein